MSCAAENSSVFRCALKVVIVTEHLVIGHREFQTAGAVIVVDWRISEYELVDDNEASHVDKQVVLFSEFYM